MVEANIEDQAKAEGFKELMAGLPLQIQYYSDGRDGGVTTEGYRQAFPPASAGTLWSTPIGGGVRSICTLAFSWFSATRAGSFTAGHCFAFPGTIQIFTLGGAYADYGNWGSGGIDPITGDTAYLNINDPYALRGQVFYAEKKYKHIDAWYSFRSDHPEDGLSPGSYIEISRGNSQSTISGTVTVRDQSYTITGTSNIVPHNTAASSCVIGGDSGSPVYTTQSGNPDAGATAAGMVSGTDSEGCSGAHVVWFSKIHNGVRQASHDIGEPVSILG